MTTLDKTQREQYSQVITQARKLYDSVASLDEWNFERKTDGGTKIYTRHDSETGIKMARGETSISKSIENVCNTLREGKTVVDYDTTIAEFNILGDWSDFQLTRILSKKTPFVAQRETVVIGQTVKLDNGSFLLLGRSIEDPLCVDKNLYVRSYLHLIAWLVTPDAKDPNLTHITYMIFIDIKGWVPVTLFNTVIREQALVPERFKEYIEKK